MAYERGEYSARLREQVARLLGAYFAEPATDKIAAFVGALRYKAVPIDRATRAVDELIATHAKCPAPAQLISAALGTAGRSQAESEVRARDVAMMRDHLSRLCDHDAHAFQAAYGVWPDRSLYDRMGVTPPAGMTFRVLPRAECDAQRKAALDACRAAFARYRTAKRDPLVAPLAPVTVARKAELREQLGQLDLADLAHSNEPEPEREETLSLDAWDGPPYGDEPLWDEGAAA